MGELWLQLYKNAMDNLINICQQNQIGGMHQNVQNPLYSKRRTQPALVNTIQATSI